MVSNALEYSISKQWTNDRLQVVSNLDVGRYGSQLILILEVIWGITEGISEVQNAQQ